jgi:hypothetical protein
MEPAVLLICWGLVAVGLVLVATAVSSVGSRLRPLRRAMRRLSWRRAEVERVQAKAEKVRERVETLATELGALSELAQARRRSATV